MKKMTKIITVFVVAVVIIGGSLTFNTLNNDQAGNDRSQDVINDNNKSADVANPVDNDGKFTNESIGFSVSIPKDYQFQEERNDITLFTAGGPTGDSMYFELETDEKHGLFIFHIASSNEDVFEKFEDYHKGAPIEVEKKVDLAWNASIITYDQGENTMLIFTPENTNKYFEFLVGGEFENPEEVLKEMYESFEVLSS